jgi:hypothetical protein
LISDHSVLYILLVQQHPQPFPPRLRLVLGLAPSEEGVAIGVDVSSRVILFGPPDLLQFGIDESVLVVFHPIELFLPVLEGPVPFILLDLFGGRDATFEVLVAFGLRQHLHFPSSAHYRRLQLMNSAGLVMLGEDSGSAVIDWGLLIPLFHYFILLRVEMLKFSPYFIPVFAFPIINVSKLMSRLLGGNISFSGSSLVFD